MSSPTVLTLSTPASLQPASLNCSCTNSSGDCTTCSSGASCDLAPASDACTCCGQSGCKCCQDNTLVQIFEQLATDCNSILISRLQSQYDSNKWNALSRQIGDLVAAADLLKRDPNAQSLIYGRIMLIITSEYLPTVSSYIGDQIAEQASIQNMASDISAFIIEAETAFNNLSSNPDCNSLESCTSSECTNTYTSTPDCTSQFELFSGIMTLIAGDTGTYDTSTDFQTETGTVPVQSYSFSFVATLSVGATSSSSNNSFSTSSSQANVIGFLSDTTFWQNIGGTPLSSSQASQISTALTGITSIFNTKGANITETNAWNSMDLDMISGAICSWTQPYGSSEASDPITTGNAPLVYTQPSTIQSDLNTAAQTVEGIATSTQTVENFQVQEIDQFYGITNSIQQSQEQQCASMVKQQTT